MTLPDQVRAILAGYRYWSRAERRILPAIENDVIRYLADGEGSEFTRMLATRVVLPKLRITE